MVIYLYAALITLFYLWQAVMVIKARYKTQIPLGDGHNDYLIAHVRAHANTGEYAPLFLILLYFTESMRGLPDWGIHLNGIAFLIARISHHFAITAPKGSLSRMPFRIAGVGLTFLPMIVCALIVLYKSARMLLQL